MKEMLSRAASSLLEKLSRGADYALDLLYPPALYCSCCGNLIDESRTYRLCDHCMAHIRWDGAEPRYLDGMKILRCTQYGLYERTLIFDLKYNGKTYIARDIAEIMADRLALARIRVVRATHRPTFVFVQNPPVFSKGFLPLFLFCVCVCCLFILFAHFLKLEYLPFS